MAGKSVTLVDVDAARIDLINAQGIMLDDDAGRHHASASAVSAAQVAGPVDLLILFTKGMHSAAAIRSVAHLSRTDCSVLTVQNGLGNAEAIAEIFPAERILWCVTDLPADLEGPNHVCSYGPGHISLGNYPGGADERARAIANLLNTSGLKAIADAQVTVAVWEKVAFNAALNALCTATGLPVGGLDHPAGRSAIKLVIDEIAAIAKAEGISVNRTRLDAKVELALTNHRAHQPSMLQDRIASRVTEIESINGAVLKIGASHGISSPALQMLTDLVRIGEQKVVAAACLAEPARP